jgi:MFS family permease
MYIKIFHTLLYWIIGTIGYSMQMPAFYALLAEMTKKEKRGLEVGLIDSSWNVVYGIVCMVSGLLVATFGFSLIFSLASFLHFSSSMIVGRKMKEILP